VKQIRSIGTTNLSRFLALSIVFVAFQSLSLADVFNAAADFSSVNNPTASGWSYGFETLGGSFTLLPMLFHDSNGFDSWQPNGSSPGAVPDIQKNVNSGAFVGGSGAFCPAACLQGGASGLAVVRWTNNTTDLSAHVTATFTGFYDGTTSLGTGTQTGYIFLDNVQWMTNSFTDVGTSHGSITLSGTAPLLPGETIDFAMGGGRIVLDGSIVTSASSVPEPHTYWLVFFAAVSMAFRARFQKAIDHP
jgi:hypothetical protein